MNRALKTIYNSDDEIEILIFFCCLKGESKSLSDYTCFEVKKVLFERLTMSASAVCSPFDAEVETLSEFLERFNLQCADLLHKARNHNQQKLSILMKALPVRVITDLQRRMKPVSLSTADYDDVIGKLKSQFEVTRSIVGATYQLFSRKQQPGESLESYSRALNDLAAVCEYQDCCRDRILRDVFILGLCSSTVLSSVLQKADALSFNDTVAHAKTMEQFANEFQEVNAEKRSFRINDSDRRASTIIPEDYVCIRCGAKAKHLADNCFAKKLMCNGCKKMGHLRIVCKSRQAPSQMNQLIEHQPSARECHGASSSSRDHGSQPCSAPEVQLSHGVVATSHQCSCASLQSPNQCHSNSMKCISDDSFLV